MTPSAPDLDLSLDRSVGPRKYPAPPTGHELMALFPPAPPQGVIYGGPTSTFFQREERAFFAQAGREIVRVHIEVDVELKDGDSVVGNKPRSRDGPSRSTSRPYPPTNPASHPKLHPPPQLSPTDAHSAPYPPTHTGRTPRSGPVTVTTQPVFPIASHPSPQHPFPPNVHPSPSSQHAGFPLPAPSRERPHHPADAGEALPEDFRDDPDEAWRRPMPHNQRRRAGKHTKRVVVK